jgi:hypothetical protein
VALHLATVIESHDDTYHSPMHPNAELDSPMHAVALVANKLGAVGGGAESEGTQPRAARALQAIPNRREAGDDRLDDDHVVVGVGVVIDGDRTVTPCTPTHCTSSSKKGRRHLRRRPKLPLGLGGVFDRHRGLEHALDADGADYMFELEVGDGGSRRRHNSRQDQWPVPARNCFTLCRRKSLRCCEVRHAAADNLRYNPQRQILKLDAALENRGSD